jgi:hypothetical protein
MNDVLPIQCDWLQAGEFTGNLPEIGYGRVPDSLANFGTARDPRAMPRISLPTRWQLSKRSWDAACGREKRSASVFSNLPPFRISGNWKSQTS